MSEGFFDFGRGLREFLSGFTGTGVAEAPQRSALPSGPRGPVGIDRDGDQAAPAQFPPGGIDFIRHDLRIMMSAEKIGYREIISMTGAMLIQRTDPYVAEGRWRRIDFKVLSWAATGWSDHFSSAITYVLSEDTDQPISTIEAEQQEFDFPASFNFNVVFDARINNETVFRQLHGRPEGQHFRQVPPTGQRAFSPTITRFADLGLVTFAHPQMGEIVVKPIDCNDQAGEVLRELPGRGLIQPLGLGGTPRGGGGGQSEG